MSEPTVKAKESKCCTHFDLEEKRCNLMGIDAPVAYMDDKGQRAATGLVVCGRQFNEWIPGAVACQVPKILAKPYKVEHYRLADVIAESGQILNQVAQEDNCPHVEASGLQGPKCGQADGPCLMPQNHAECAIYGTLLDDKLSGRKLREKIEREYGKMEKDICGTETTVRT